MLYTFGPFTLNEQLCQLVGPSGVIPMERRLFDLLVYLIRNRTRVISKGELVRAIWSNRVVSDASLSVAMTGVRRALDDNAATPRFIVTHNARGYRFAEAVIESAAPSGTQADSKPQRQTDLFVGRAGELRLAQEAADAAREGSLQILLISGEAGIGKSRFLDLISRDLSAKTYQVLSGRCPEAPGAPAFWPWTQILRQHFGSLLPGTLPSALAGVEDIVQILPELSPHLRSTVPPTPRDPVRARFRLFDAIGTCLERLAKRVPTAIFIEDIHRSDEASLLLLSFLVESFPASPLLVAVTLRDGVHHAFVDKAVGALVRAASVTLVPLEGLVSSESAALLSQLTGETASTAIAADLHERTKGNPYFLTQLAKHLNRLGDISSASLPEDLATSLAGQIDDLSEQAKGLLFAAAVSGVDFEVPTVCEVVSIPDHEALGLLGEALRAGVVSQDSTPLRIKFRHSLVRDALYQRISPQERAYFHQRFAQVLAYRHGIHAGHHLPQIAHHFYEAAASGVTEVAIRYSLEAGKWSSLCLAYEDAAHFFRKGTELLDLLPGAQRELRCELLIRLGEQLLKAGEPEAAREAFGQASRLATSLGASRLLAEAALAASPGLLAIESGVVDTFLVELLDTAIGHFAESRCSLYARLAARLSLALHWSEDHERARELAERAALVTDAELDMEAKSSIQQALWYTRHGPAFVADRRGIASALISHDRNQISPETQLVSQLFWLYSLLERGQMRVFEEEREAYRRLAEKVKQPQGLWYAGMLDAMLALLRGNFHEATMHTEAFATLGRRMNDANAVHSQLAHAALITYELGDLRGAIPMAQSMAERFPSLIVWQASVAWMLALVGDARHSTELVSRLVDELPTTPVRMDWSGAIALLGEAAALNRDRHASRTLYEVLSPLHDSYVILGVCTLCWGSAARTLGLLAECVGDEDRAARHFEQSVALDAKIGARPWAAHGEFSLARLMRARGERDRAIQLASSAALTSRNLGMLNLYRSATEFLNHL